MELYFLILLPLVLFVLVDFYKGLKAGVVTATVFAVGMLLYLWFKTGTLDEFLLGETLLIVVLGLLTLRLNDSKYFKFQPVCVGVIFAAIFSYYQIFDQPIMVKILPSMVALAPELEEQMMDQKMSVLLSQLSFGMIIVLLLHSALVAWVALRMGNLAWIFSRVAIYPMVLVMTIVMTAMSSQ